MLPTILVTILSALFEGGFSTPLYSMHPASILTNIGTTGRNIRNLPCISRKSNQKGVCMFAIDCLKSNGTHLGTCIDRFYFGSCCHIEPVHDVDNSLNTAIIPSREPPSRISTTEKITTITTEKLTTMRKFTSPTTPKDVETTKSISSTSTERISSTSSTLNTINDLEPEVKVSEKPLANYGDKITTFKTTKVPQTTTLLYEETTEFPYKFTTFQSVQGSDVTTIKPLKTTIGPLSTKPFPLSTKPFISSIKPFPSSIKPIFSTRPVPLLTRPVPLSTKAPYQPSSVVPSRPTLKPKPTKPKPLSTTPKPTRVTNKVTEKPISITKPTRVPTKPSLVRTTTTRAPINTRRTTTQGTTKPVKETEKPSTTTRIPSTPVKLQEITTTTVKTTTSTPNATESSTATPTTTTTIKTTITPTTSTTTQSNDLILSAYNSSAYGLVGNLSTNEIEQKPLKEPTTTLGPSLVTWAIVDKETTTAANSSEDSWVLLPSLSTAQSVSTTVTTTSTTTTTTTNKPMEEPANSTVTTESTTLSSTTLGSSTTTKTTETSAASVSSEEPPVGSSTPTTSSEAPIVTPTTTDHPINMSDFTDVCGRRMFPEARIVGGKSSTFGKWPWQISLRQWRTSTYLHKCGAALLNENWAITAAHCVDNVPPSDLLLRLGEHDLSTDGEPYLHQERRVQIVASHPQFDPRTFEYDLALLRFHEPVQFQPNIIPVCVPEKEENFVGRTAYVTGWGRLYEDGPLPSILQEVSVPVINNTVCESMYRSAGYIEHIPHIFICAGWRRGGYDSCEGDSGGPMVIQRQDKRFLLAGVISWGIGCAEANQPGVYTRISEFRDWINQILQF